MKTPAAPTDPTFCARIVSRGGRLLPIWFLPALVATSLLRQVTSSLPLGMSTFPLQVLAFTIFTPKNRHFVRIRCFFPFKRSLPLRMFILPSQVPDLTLFNPFYLRTIRPHSTSFRQKTPVIPPIPLNSTYVVPRNDVFLTNAKMSTFPSQVPATTN